MELTCKNIENVHMELTLKYGKTPLIIGKIDKNNFKIMSKWLIIHSCVSLSKGEGGWRKQNINWVLHQAKLGIDRQHKKDQGSIHLAHNWSDEWWERE